MPGKRKPATGRGRKLKERAARMEGAHPELSKGEIARRLGMKSKRALRGITLVEWRRAPAYAALVEKYAGEAMSKDEWLARNAMVARLEVPSRVELGAKGQVLRTIFDSEKAMERQARALGIAERHELTGSGTLNIQLAIINALGATAPAEVEPATARAFLAKVLDGHSG